MPTSSKPPSRRISVIRKTAAVPTLAQMIREGQESATKIKRASKEALAEWFAQSERLNVARSHYGLRGARFIDFAGRIGVDSSSAYQLIKLWKHRSAILARCLDEGRYYGWETCLYWYERAPRQLWHKDRDGKYDNDEYATPPSVFRKFGSACTLDVCATTGKAMCLEHFTKAQDGLKLRWHGRVWCNPPYSSLYPWCAKAFKYAKAGGTTIALLPAWTDAPWFHDFVSYGRITFLRGKLSYVGRQGYAPFGSMIVEWNPKTVKRARGAPLDAILDTGIARSGLYVAG
jgi:DNA N-6-adenine-methyltransferase (Dam)